MAENTQIEWADHTFNPWEGCQKVAPECDNCYAEARNERFHKGINWGPKAPRRRTSVANWNKPKRWNKDSAAFLIEHGRRQRVFCASLADVFDNVVDPAWRDDLFELIRATPDLDWMLLTKRPQNMIKMLPEDWGDGWPNVWLGTSAGMQKTADMNIPHLLNTPAAIRFVSAEPLLGPIDLKTRWIYPDLRHHAGPRLNWVIVGGESGHRARPMHPDWARHIRDQCEAAGVPFLFKQWGEWGEDHGKPIEGLDRISLGTAKCAWLKKGEWQFEPSGFSVDLDAAKDSGAWVYRVGKKSAGRLLDGREWNDMPEVE